MREVQVEQKTQAWYAERKGRITASAAEFLTRRTEASWSTLAEMVRGEKRFTGNDATEWGNNHEARALAEVRFELEVDTRLVGFVIHPEMDFVGASPDAYIEQLDAGVEIKCPYRSENHLAAAGGMPAKHIAQVQFQMMVTGWPRVVFASFDPRQPVDKQLFLHVIPRNEAYIADLERGCRDFWRWFSGEAALSEIIAAGAVSGKAKKGVIIAEDIF